MALSVGNRYLASEFINLNARVKAEMQRRKYKGSLVTYASASYDYTVTPTANSVVLPEHVNKIVEPLNAINDTGVDTGASGDVIKALDKANAFLTTAESYSVTSKTTDCKSTCTGLCVTTCGSSCSGCSGSCTGQCTSCSGCSGTCTSSCARACNSCMTDCTGACAEGCSSSCMGGCKNGCKGSCTGSCTGTASSAPV